MIDIDRLLVDRCDLAKHAARIFERLLVPITEYSPLGVDWKMQEMLIGNPDTDILVRSRSGITNDINLAVGMDVQIFELEFRHDAAFLFRFPDTLTLAKYLLLRGGDSDV